MSNIVKRLESVDYEHPLDREALKMIKRLPLLDTIVQAYINFWMKMNVKVAIHGNDMLVTPETFPRVHRLKQKALQRLNLPQDYPVYMHLEWDYDAYVVGVDHPVIVLNSYLVQDFTDDELLFVLGHEMGHIKSGHILYYQMVKMIVNRASRFTHALLTAGMQLALFEWARKSELTADRAGLLVCGDTGVACSAMAKLMGVATDAKYFTPSMESIIEQAEGLDMADAQWNSKIIYFIATSLMSHPWLSLRINEIQKWGQTEQYHDVSKLIF